MNAEFRIENRARTFSQSAQRRTYTEITEQIRHGGRKEHGFFRVRDKKSRDHRAGRLR